MTEVAGTHRPLKILSRGASMSEQDRRSHRHRQNALVIDWRMSPRSANLRPALVIKGKDGKNRESWRAAATARLPACRSRSIISFEPGSKVNAGDVHHPHLDQQRQDARHHGRSAARGGAVRSASSPRIMRSSRKISGDDSVRARLQEQATRGRSFLTREGAEPVEYLIPKRQAHPSAGRRRRGEGGLHRRTANPAPHDILAIKGVRRNLPPIW